MNEPSTPPSSVHDALDFRHLLQSLNLAVALVEPARWAIVFENAKFFHWFPLDADPDAALDQRIKGLDLQRLATRLEERRRFGFETEAHDGRRDIPVRLEFRPLADSPYVMVEGRDISKERETQYMLDSYSKMVEKSTRDLQKEKDRVERLLLNIMPKSVYEELKDFGTATPQRFESASILMLDFVRFTDMAVSQDPSALVSELNDIFSAFDRIVEMFGCERLRTIGDSYMAVSGLPERTPEHAQNIAKVALRMRRYLERRNASHPQQWRGRIGINTGPVIGSLVGIQKYVYDLFGPGVNLAARMESHSEPMRITLCEETYQILKDEFVFSERGEFDIKGFGRRKLYFLEDEARS
ncbi:MAG: adenylate/guanylate cyclase domain-containing protein [Gammaproteobacteria bacterium]|nr:adenylate/guanylate cyclase domain-containing protein [Gammaproteobacteria bacterium]NIR83581.1 adenylate/guanylate cyclase domain-containing protein [Gammaproteobacteria bacterium]NIR91503.1 adenylate/guanylate cyclase domain-containing protein [Gammaproteobacteria bacterium]NIU04743.1 adenylate/guanylate cyclase domain-containing protein [Gammaproteobacteria bacterium]NIV51785.1 adenylate/guanylate cyclase domain-containing protein [Gammaproteobacteria bacterium]